MLSTALCVLNTYYS